MTFFNCATARSWQGLLIIGTRRSHSDTPHSVDSSGRVISPTQISLLDNTQHSEEIDIHALGGIRTRNPNKRTAADPCLRPRGHQDRRLYIIEILFTHSRRNT
jgi:hypothetical protein